MKYEVIVDNEWIYEGDWDTCCKIADSYWADEDAIHSVYVMSEDEFYGNKEA